MTRGTAQSGHPSAGPGGASRDSRGWTLRIGSISGVVGALIGMVGNLIHPATSTNDMEHLAQTIASSDIWVIDHLAIVIALPLMLAGLIAIRHSIPDGIGGAFAAFGQICAVAGTTVGVILVTLDGLAAKHLAIQWTRASPDAASVALRILEAEEAVNFALASLFNILFAGLAFGLYGLAIVMSNVYPKWLGWVVVGAAVGSVCAGVAQALAGSSTPSIRLMTIVFPTVITLWLATMSALVLKRTLPKRRPALDSG